MGLVRRKSHREYRRQSTDRAIHQSGQARL